MRPANLGQPPAEFAKVVVVDSRGIPCPDARVSIFDRSGRELYDISTDSRGEVAVDHGAGPVDIRVEVDGYVLRERVESLDETVFVRLPVCRSSPILTATELGLFALSAALAGAGVYWKRELPKIAGEVLFGAVVFTAVYRNSCASG